MNTCKHCGSEIDERKAEQLLQLKCEDMAWNSYEASKTWLRIKFEDIIVQRLSDDSFKKYHLHDSQKYDAYLEKNYRPEFIHYLNHDFSKEILDTT